MRLLLASLLVLTPAFVYANPGVKANTDIGKRKVKSHKQVTRCENGKCTVNSVTTFDKKSKKSTAYADCTIAQRGDKRFSHCETYKKKKKPKVKVVTKTKVVNKKNRLQLHVGSGPHGLYDTSDNNRTAVKEHRKFLIGGHYSRLLEDDLSLGVAVFTNKSITLSIGFDY